MACVTDIWSNFCDAFVANSFPRINYTTNVTIVHSHGSAMQGPSMDLGAMTAYTLFLHIRGATVRVFLEKVAFCKKNAKIGQKRQFCYN